MVPESPESLPNLFNESRTEQTADCSTLWATSLYSLQYVYIEKKKKQNINIDCIVHG